MALSCLDTLWQEVSSRAIYVSDAVGQVEDDEWFFDTELLLLAEECGLHISEVPVDWIEDLDSRVGIVDTVTKSLKGLLRVRMQRLWRRSSGAV